MTTAYLDKPPADIGYCDVRTNDLKIVVNFFDDHYGGAIYSGRNDGTGHFALTCEGRPNWRASFRRFPEGSILEGYWIEEGYEGF